MENQKATTRKNFRCTFNEYITRDNRYGVIQSIISQFQGYYAEPELTVHDDGFVLSVLVGDNLSPTMVRDKILWNQFIENVSIQDTIRQIQVLRLPRGGVMDFGDRMNGEGSVGGFGPTVDPTVGDTEVNEKLNIPRTTKPPKYMIDADPDDSLGWHANVHTADPSSDALHEDQSYATDPDITAEGLDSYPTKVEKDPHSDLDAGRKLPRIFNAFKKISIDTDVGSSFTMNHTNGMTDVDDAPPGTGIGGGDPYISGASWYVYDPLNAQGTKPGDERAKDYGSSPFGNITTGKKGTEDPEEEDVDSALDLPQARGGGQAVPDGGQVEGWFAKRYAHQGEHSEHPPFKSVTDMVDHCVSHHHNVVDYMYRSYVDQTGEFDRGELMHRSEFGQKLLTGEIHPTSQKATNFVDFLHESEHLNSHLRPGNGGDHPHNHKKDIKVKIPNDLSRMTAAIHMFGINEYYDYEGDVDGDDL